jgi:methylated-DNA-[protein]-cysteine S-methyltransferase
MGQCSKFQKSVYNALLKIPRGKVTTYKILAAHLSSTGRSAGGGKCRSCRAVGQALRHNPFAPKVPCHRVIASDLSPGGFSALGETSSKDGHGQITGAPIRRKLKLLATEGVKFTNGHLAEPGLIWRFNQEK